VTTRGKKTSKKIKKIRVAVLGGGDIGFPLMFAGVVLKTFGIGYALIIPPFATLALAGLFFYSKKDRFYPAMPFLSIGCVAGLGVVYLVQYMI